MTEQKGHIFRFAEFEVQPGEFCLVRNGETIPVEPKAFRVLLYLLRNPQRLVTKDELLDAVWQETSVSENSLTRSIALLRRLLGDDTREPRYIATVPTVGYRFVADVRVSDGFEKMGATSTDGGEALSGLSASLAPAASVVGSASASNQSPPPKIARSSKGVLHRSDRGGRLLWLVIGMLALLIVVGLAAVRLAGRRGSTAPIRSLAVLPLENLSGDASQEYFADGMTDELITELARVPGLRVVSRTSAMQEKGSHKKLLEIARDLNVDAIVEGTVLRSADKVRITAQLIDVGNDKHLWAQSFEGRTDDTLSLQDDIAREIASQARVALTPPAVPGVSGAKRIDPAAHDAYLRGQYFLDRQEAPKSADYFQQAISIDPSYAAAFAGLADALWTEAAYNFTSYAEILPKARAAAKHAIELDPTNGQAYSVLGILEAQGEWNWEAAERDLQRGIALSPNDSFAIVKYAIYLDAVGRPEQAVAQMRKAVELDPLSFFMNRHLGSTLYFARHYDEALYYLRRAGEIDPNAAPIVDNWIGFIYEKKGMQDEAVRSELSSLSPDVGPRKIDALRSAYSRGGWTAYQEARIELISSYGDGLCNPYAIGTGYLRLGDRDRAFASFNKATDHHCVWMTFVKVDPLLDDIRTDPRYHKLIQRMNLPE